MYLVIGETKWLNKQIKETVCDCYKLGREKVCIMVLLMEEFCNIPFIVTNGPG